ncbi:integrator complex subunit 5-like [Paramuricea clavata]|uniref:Integrator complex subunit 5-like n=1 Tax=Paramuricea clavata TaxID=317549 RepID=A0A6S7I2D6_PARCT|nr:integrator complex subunit 5-like [Paramuricea clavata]
MAQMESENLLQEVRSFVLPSKGPGGNVNILERTKSAIVLMRCLPCARAAVLEQICEIFQEAVHKYIIESDRQDLLGSGEKAEVDPEIYDVIENIHDTLLEFINNNPDAWAPIVTKWSVYLLGQLSAKYATQRGTKASTSLNERLQVWLTCPAAQMLMEISAQCFSKLIDTNPDVCIQYLLDSAVQHSPHFDWVVAYIGSYFYKSIISHLLSCAMNEFYSDEPCDDEFSDLFRTAIRILDYFAQKYPEEVKNAVLAMFQESTDNVELGKPKWTKSKTQPCLIPFFVHLGMNAANILNVTIVAFLEQLTPDVMRKVHYQLTEWGSAPGNHAPSLLSSVVGLVISLKHGTFKTFQYLLTIAVPNTESNESDGTEIQDICFYSAMILEKVFIHLQRLVTKKHRAESASADGKGTGQSGNKDSSNDIPFLNELKEKWKELCDQLLNADGQRLSWILRLLSLVAVYSGPATCIEIFNYILTFKRTSQHLSMFVELQKEVQAFYTRAPDLAVSKCLKRISIKSSPDILTEVQTTLENLHQLMEMEKIVGQDYAGFSVGRCLRQHTTLLVSFLSYPNKAISSITLDLLVALGFPFITFSVSDKMKIVKTCASFFFKLLHQYNTACQQERYEVRHRCLDMLKKYQVLLSIICRDEPCQILAVRHFMEGAFHQENKSLFCKRKQAQETAGKSDNSLFSKNITPGISSRLPLNTASVFYLGVIGKGKKSEEQEILQVFSQSNSQFFLQCIHTICHSSRPPNPSAMEPHNVKIFANLALLLKDLIVVDGTFDCGTWPDEDDIKYSIGRDVSVLKQFDESEIFWHLLFLLAEVPRVLPNCLPIIHGLFSSILKFWEQCREPNTYDCPTQLYASVQIMSILRKAMWLPRPLCLGGDIFHIISPKEIHKLLETIWAFFKENPPTVNTRIVTEIPDGRHKNVVKSTFLGNIAELGHLYARFFPVHDRT